MGWLRVRVSNCFTSCFNQFEFIVKVVVRIEVFIVNFIMKLFIVSVKLREVLNFLMEVFIVSVSMEEFIIIVIVILVILID